MTKKENSFAIFTVVGTIVVAAVSLLTYLNNRQHSKLQTEITALDKNIKELQLEKLKKENGKS